MSALDDKIHAEWTARWQTAATEVEKSIEGRHVFMALDLAREDSNDALDSLKNAAFGIVDCKHTKGKHASTLKLALEALERAKEKYAQKLLVYRRLEALAKADHPITSVVLDNRKQ